eukprot:g71438.t1
MSFFTQPRPVSYVFFRFYRQCQAVSEQDPLTFWVSEKEPCRIPYILASAGVISGVIKTLAMSLGGFHDVRLHHSADAHVWKSLGAETDCTELPTAVCSTPVSLRCLVEQSTPVSLRRLVEQSRTPAGTKTKRFDLRVEVRPRCRSSTLMGTGERDTSLRVIREEVLDIDAPGDPVEGTPWDASSLQGFDRSPSLSSFSSATSTPISNGDDMFNFDTIDDEKDFWDFEDDPPSKLRPELPSMSDIFAQIRSEIQGLATESSRA